MTAMSKAGGPKLDHRCLLLFIGVLAPLFVLGMLAEDVVEKDAFALDNPTLLFMRQYARPWLDKLMLASSVAGSALVLVPVILVTAVWLYRRHNPVRTWFFSLAVAGAAGLNFIAKLCFSRVRPSLWLSIRPETSFSFPSGHAMASMAVAAALIWLVPKHSRWRLPALLAGVIYVLLVGTSRIYLGVHFPSDVLAGWMASFAWVTGLALLFRLHRAPPPVTHHSAPGES